MKQTWIIQKEPQIYDWLSTDSNAIYTDVLKKPLSGPETYVRAIRSSFLLITTEAYPYLVDNSTSGAPTV